MKKILLALLITCTSVVAQIKVKDLPTTTTGTLADYLIKDYYTGAAGATQKITIANFLTTYGIVKTVVLNTPSILYTTPVTFVTTGNTSTGTLSLINQTANTVFAGPTSGGAASPTFRALVAADIPTLSGSYWSLVGNSGTVAGTNFLGNIDSVDFVLKTNDIERMRMTGNARLGIGTNAPTGFISATGYKPASVATTPGTSSSTIGKINLTGADGGNTTIATTGVGGLAGGIQLNGGAGGVATSATTSSTGGISGSISLFAGTSPANSTVTSTLTKSGLGGSLIILTGSSANASGSTGTNTGGAAGGFTILGGNAGNGVGTGGTTTNGGSGSGWSTILSTGGSATGAASGTNTGGAGGGWAITTGAGGSAADAATNIGGSAGSINFTASLGGSGSTSSGFNGKFSVTTNSTINFVVDSVGGVRAPISFRSPLIIGGTGTTSTLTLRTTTGVGTTNSDIIFQGGNNGGTEFGRFINAGALLVGGATQLVAGSIAEYQMNSNATLQYVAQNSSAGAAATTQMLIRNDLGASGNMSLGVTSSGYTTAGMLVQGQAYIRTNTTGLNIGADNGSGVINFYSGGNAIKAKLDASGRFAVGNTAPTQEFEVTGDITIVGGFLYMKDAITPFNYWKGTMTTGVLIWTDTGSATKP